ncbi:MAG: RecQ family ATP-dependent DNA helicase [Kiritimatiellia bacterium]
MYSCHADKVLEEALLKHFGYASFRDGQQSCISTVLNGKDAVLVMPTGSGKSLCYQLSALLMPGVTIVISPLIALMKDQVDALAAQGISATCLNSSVNSSEMSRRLNGLRNGDFKLVYVAPERFRNRFFRDALSACELSMLTVDEAHCISQWGHDFRPDYLNLKDITADYSDARIMAVTATATPEVREDIIEQLGMGKNQRSAPSVFVTGFARPNLSLNVTRCSNHDHKLRRTLSVVQRYRCGIVYCSTRKMVERVSGKLSREGISSLIYHGAMTDNQRTRTQDQFVRSESPVVVATNAFGMGVDRGDLRFVVHWDVPGSLESYYQEVGRCGRDGGESWCEMLFNYADVRTQKFFIEGGNPSAEDVHSLWMKVKENCREAENGQISLPQNEWAAQAGIRNPMAAGTIMAMLERAGLVSREIMPGQRCYTVQMGTVTDERKISLLISGLSEKRKRDERKLQRFLRYVDHPGCRHDFILHYFGERTKGGCGSWCDCCRAVNSLPGEGAEPTESQWIAIQKILSCVVRMHGRFGCRKVAAVLKGGDDEALKRHSLHRLSTFGLLSDWPLRNIYAVVNMLTDLGCIAQTPDDYRLLSLTEKGRRVLFKKEKNFRISWPEDFRTEKKSAFPVKRKTAERSASPSSDALREKLRNWARGKAACKGIPVYQVLTKSAVEGIAASRPGNLDDLLDIKGVGPVKLRKYGNEILDIVDSYCTGSD